MSDSATPWTAACQAPLSMEYSRQECWSGLPFPSPGDLPNPGIKPRVSWIAGRLFTIRATREALTLLLRAFRTCVTSQMKGRCHQGNQRPPAETPCRDPLACTQWGALEPCAPPGSGPRLRPSATTRRAVHVLCSGPWRPTCVPLATSVLRPLGTARCCASQRC